MITKDEGSNTRLECTELITKWQTTSAARKFYNLQVLELKKTYRVDSEHPVRRQQVAVSSCLSFSGAEERSMQTSETLKE